MATPSISLIPSGYKANKLYSVLPTNGNADLDVVRNSTANRINKDGLIEEMAVNVSLLDYSDSTCPSLLLQPQSTNLITYPLSFDNSYWTKSGATVTSGHSAPSVDNPTSAFKLVADNVTNQSYMNRSVTVTATSNYTFSILAKKGEVDFICLVGLNPFTASYFDLANGVTLGNTAVSSSIEDYGNGWYRCSIEMIADTSSKFCGIYLSANGTSLTATSIADGDGVYIFGAQIEQQSYPTSLMLPVTEGSTTTRLKDEVSKSGLSADINSEEGTLFVEAAALSDDSTNRNITLSDGTDTNRFVLKFDNQSNIIQAFNRVAGVETAFLGSAVGDITLFNKIAVKYKANDFALWINGVEVDTDLSGASFPSNTLSVLSFSQSDTFYSKVNDLQVFKTALSDTELAELTS